MIQKASLKRFFRIEHRSDLMSGIEMKTRIVNCKLFVAAAMTLLGWALLTNVASAQPNELPKKTFTLNYKSHSMKRFWRVCRVPGRVSHFKVHVYARTGYSVAYFQKGQDSVTVTGRTGGNKKKGVLGTGGRERGLYYAWLDVYYYPRTYGNPIDIVSPIPRPGRDRIKEFVLVRFRNETGRPIRLNLEWYPGRTSDTVTVDSRGGTHSFWLTASDRFWKAMKRGYPRAQTKARAFGATGGVDIIKTYGRPPRFNDRQGTYEKILVFKLRAGRLQLVKEPF